MGGDAASAADAVAAAVWEGCAGVAAAAAGEASAWGWRGEEGGGVVGAGKNGQCQKEGITAELAGK